MGVNTAELVLVVSFGVTARAMFDQKAMRVSFLLLCTASVLLACTGTSDLGRSSATKTAPTSPACATNAAVRPSLR